MNLLEQAIAIALEAHRGQVDKAAQPYILHPLRVMLKMNTDKEMIVAVLHDVVEDSKISLEDLQSRGFFGEIIDAVKCCTKKHGMPYEEYIQQIGKNPLASRVKIADLQDNMNLARLPHPSQDDFDRVDKYREALAFLQKEA